PLFLPLARLEPGSNEEGQFSGSDTGSVFTCRRQSRRNTPVPMSSKSFGTSATIRSRSPSRSPPDASTDAFSSSLTTTVFSQRSMRRLEASLRRATPKGHETFISRTAPHQGPAPTSSPPRVQDTPRHPQHGRSSCPTADLGASQQLTGTADFWHPTRTAVEYSNAIG